MWVKICGITRLEDAVAAARFGADAVGFVFAESPRWISPDGVREISRSMPAGPVKVGVFVDTPLDEVRETVEYCSLDFAQLHGDEDERYCELLGDRVIKAFRVKESADIVRALRCPCGTVLLDGYASRRGEADGACDWRFASALSNGKRVIIAGGLGPGNVAGAVKALKPYGVDVSSGVERAPGVKDAVLMYEFIEKARKADHEVNGD